MVQLNPLLPNVPQIERLAKKIYFKLRRGHQKIFYERSDYESADKKILSLAMSRKTIKKLIQAVKGRNNFISSH